MFGTSLWHTRWLRGAPLFALTAQLLGATTAAAQVTRVSGAAIDSAASAAQNGDGRGGYFRAASDGGAIFVLNRRTTSSEIELHCGWDDILVVRSGHGVVRYSSKLRGLRRTGGREWRADEMVTPTDVPLAPGDVVRIAAGEGHQVDVIGEAPLVYLIVKVSTPLENPCAGLPRR